MNHLQHQSACSRRAFLRGGTLVLGAAASFGSRPQTVAAEELAAKPDLRVGLITDCHYADRDPAGSRHYRDSLKKVAEAVARFNDAQANLAVELGDFIDAAPEVETEIEFLRTIDREYARFHGDRHYVLGNHCVYTLTKEEFVANSAMPRPYYAFDQGDFHFVILDACYREDGVDYGRKNYEWTDTHIPAAEVDWLQADLERATQPTIVMVHQRLDLDRDDELGKSYAVKNAAQIRQILEQSGKVSLVLQGHSHENAYRQIKGIHYCVLRAVVEGAGLASSGYALLDLFADGSLRIQGFREQQSHAW